MRVDRKSFLLRPICFLGLLIMGVFVLDAASGQQRTLSQWQAFHDALRKRVLDNAVKYPRGNFKGSCDPYVEALGVAARDRDESLAAAQEAQASKDAAVRALFDKFMDIVDLAQDNGNAALNFADVLLRVEDNFDPIPGATLSHRAKNYGKCLYDEARRLKFDHTITRRQVRIMLEKAIKDLDEGFSLRCEAVPGNAQYCGLMYPDLERNPNPLVEPNLKQADEVRQISPYFELEDLRRRADDLMNRYLKDALCLLRDKSHQEYLDLAKQYRLDDAAAYIEGFYAKVNGKVTVDDGTGEKPAPGAKVEIRDPKDGKTWTTTADENGRYEITGAPLHAHVGPKGRPRCPEFEIRAEYKGDRVEDTYPGPLQEPNRNEEYEKNLLILPNSWEGTIEYRWEAKSAKGESLLTTILPGGDYESTESWRLRVKFKKDRGNENVEVYALVSARLEFFEEKLDATAMDMQKEDRRIKVDMKDGATARFRTLSPEECGLELAIDLKKNTYVLSGSLDVKNIPSRSTSRMEMVKAPVDHRETDGDQGTTNIDQSIEIEGRLAADSPVKAKGVKDLTQDLGPDLKKFLEDMGGKQQSTLRWDLVKHAKK